MAQAGPRASAGQEHRLADVMKKRQSSNVRLAVRFLASETQRAEDENRLISGFVGSGSGQHAARTKGGSPWRGFLSWGDSQFSVFISTTRRSGQSATNSCWRRQALKFGGPGLWIIGPRHPVHMKLKSSFKGLVARVQATPKALPSPIVGCAREHRCWDVEQSTSMDERWTQLMQSTEQEILGGCDVLGDEARACTGRGTAPRWVIKKVEPRSRTTGPEWPRTRDGGGFLSNRLRELWLLEDLPTRRSHLPQQPEQIERLRAQLRRMAKEAQTDDGDLGNGHPDVR